MISPNHIARFTRVRVIAGAGQYSGYTGYVEADNRAASALSFRGIRVMLYIDDKQVGTVNFKDDSKLELEPLK